MKQMVIMDCDATTKTSDVPTKETPKFNRSVIVEPKSLITTINPSAIKKQQFNRRLVLATSMALAITLIMTQSTSTEAKMYKEKKVHVVHVPKPVYIKKPVPVYIEKKVPVVKIKPVYVPKPIIVKKKEYVPVIKKVHIIQKVKVPVIKKVPYPVTVKKIKVVKVPVYIKKEKKHKSYEHSY